MSAWRGLANPERHAPTSVTDMAWCNVCDGPCYSPEACCCCLAAEVERLERAEAAIARVRELHRPCLDPHLHDGNHCCLECSDYGRQGAVRMYSRMWPCPTIRAIDGGAA